MIRSAVNTDRGTGIACRTLNDAGTDGNSQIHFYSQLIQCYSQLTLPRIGATAINTGVGSQNPILFFGGSELYC